MAILEHEAMKMDMAIFMGQCRTEAVFQVGGIQRFGDFNYGPFAGNELGDAFDPLALP